MMTLLVWVGGQIYVESRREKKEDLDDVKDEEMKDESSKEDSGSDPEASSKAFKDDGDVRDVRYNLERLHKT